MTKGSKLFDAQEWLAAAADDPLVAEQIAYMKEVPARDALYREIRTGLHPALTKKLQAMGMDKLYSHQALAFDAAMQGKDLIVTTGTNSGKSLCYNLPALQIAMAEPAARVLYLFPTKALAQDQAAKLEALVPSPSIKVGIYDGDTPTSQRGPIRKLSHMVLTNPDMLHVGILPGHELWTTFLKSLRLIVIDEMHVYRGIFGSHVGNVLRRLLRLCEWHHSYPQIIACSATISDPESHFEKLTSRPANVIDRDGSPAGKKTIAFWNPPQLPTGNRLSANAVTSELLATLVQQDIRTLAFNRTRVSAELVLRYARESLEKRHVPQDIIESYRGGYTPRERRQIEKAIFKGGLKGLSATDAMELGVDIGGLDVVLMNGYPGSISSFWQQTGRSGRGTRDGAAIMIAHDDPLEQYLVAHPDEIFERKAEPVALNPENPQILASQLLCAAHERAVAPSELAKFGPTAIDAAESLDRSGELAFRAGQFFYPSHEAPAANVNIRSAGGETIRLLHNFVEIGTMEYWRALNSAHEGAIYLHRGQTYIIDELNLEEKVAHVRPAHVDYYTQSMQQALLMQNIRLRMIEKPLYSLSLIGASITDSVIGFRRKALDGGSIMSTEVLELPPMSYDTIALRIDFPEPLEEDPLRAIGGIHGVEHALAAVAPFYAGCDRGDLGTAWYSVYHDTLQPAVFIYDRTPGGVGLCEKLYEVRAQLLKAAFELLSDCDCPSGCPSCLLTSRCEVNNETLHKGATLEHLEEMLAFCRDDLTDAL